MTASRIYHPDVSSPITYAATCGASWLGYLVLQGVGRFLGNESIHGALFQIGAGMLFWFAILMACRFFKPRFRKTAVFTLTLNTIAVGMFMVSVTRLLEQRPDIPAYESLYSWAQILICLAVFPIGRAALLTKNVNLFAAILLCAHCGFWILRNTLQLTGHSFIAVDDAAIILTYVAEISFALAMLWAARDLKKEIAETHTMKRRHSFA